VYNYETDEKTAAIMNQIRGYANEIQCSDFHGKGTIDDYKILFQAASNIANESSQMTLDVDVSGFSEFGQAADQLSALFTSFISKLENVNIINDAAFLQTIATALQKIVNLSNVFGKFKDTIVATSTIRLPKSVVDTQLIMNNVMQEVNCAMNYMTYFVNPADTSLTAAALSDNDKSVITNAVQTITNWNTLCDQGVTVTMANDVHIKALAQTNVQLKAKTNILQSITSTLQSKLASYKL
jgi:flagellin-specific chaperone FliS